MTVPAERPHEALVAVGIRHDLDLGHGRIDPTKVARALGLEVVHYPVVDDGVEGQYRPLPDGTGAIFVNSHCSRLRQRFTVAHEIGHALFHPGSSVVDSDLTRRSNKRPERQADRFAGALLVDLTTTTSIVASWSGNLDAAVADVVSVFDVSVPTAAISLQQFGLATRDDVSAFMQRYRYAGHRRFMESHGRRSRHRAGSGKLVLDPAFKARVVYLMSRGQLDPDRAAAMLGRAVEDLPESAVASYRELAAFPLADPAFD